MTSLSYILFLHIEYIWFLIWLLITIILVVPTLSRSLSLNYYVSFIYWIVILQPVKLTHYSK